MRNLIRFFGYWFLLGAAAWLFVMALCYLMGPIHWPDGAMTEGQSAALLAFGLYASAAAFFMSLPSYFLARSRRHKNS